MEENQKFDMPKKPVRSAIKWICIVCGCMFVLTMCVAMFSKNRSNNGEAAVENVNERVNRFTIDKNGDVAALNINGWNKIETTLANATISEIDQSALIELFNYGSNATNVQRENAEKEIKDKCVEWWVQVYEVSKINKDQYKILTQSPPSASCLIKLFVRDDDEKNAIESLKTGQSIRIRGIIDGLGSMRTVMINPAMIWVEERTTWINQNKKN